MGLKRIAILAALLVALVRLDGREIAEGRDSALLLKSTVVEPEDLPALMADVRKNRIRLLDARLAQAYQAGHPRRATWVAEEAWRNVSITYASYTPEDPVPLYNLPQWAQRIGQLGIGQDTPVIIYDGGAMKFSSRIWFLLQHFGVQQIALVNGGFSALEPLFQDGRLHLNTRGIQWKIEQFSPETETGPVGLFERADVLAALNNPAFTILDVRTPAEYDGSELSPYAVRAGHIPGAINLPLSLLLDANGRLQPPPQLQHIFAQAGVFPDRHIVPYCADGARSSLVSLALHQAGYPTVSLYYRSFDDWAADPDLPVVK